MYQLQFAQERSDELIIAALFFKFENCEYEQSASPR
jgi:hypothetical protein